MRRRQITRVLVIAIAGLLTTVGVAWALALTHPPLVTHQQFVWQSGLRDWGGRVPSDWDEQAVSAVFRSTGRSFASFSAESAASREARKGQDPRVALLSYPHFEMDFLFTMTTGLPWPALRYELTFGASDTGSWRRGIPLTDAPPLPFIPVRERLPLVPCWPGFLFNWAFFAACWSIALFGRGTWQAVRRRRRQQCVACGYALRHVCSQCPECGSVLDGG